MLATVSRLPARTVVRLVTISGASASWPLSARRLFTSSWMALPRGTIRAEPALMSMRGGMSLRLRSALSLMPTRCAASVTLRVRGAVQTVQLAYWPWS